jgi:hypothetical protein
MGCFAESGTPRFVFNDNGNGNDDDNGNNKASTKSVLQLRLNSEVMCIFVLYLVEYRLFRLF